MTIILILLFLYSSWAFVRIGQLCKKVDKNTTITHKHLAELWEELSKLYIEILKIEDKNRKNTKDTLH